MNTETIEQLSTYIISSINTHIDNDIGLDLVLPILLYATWQLWLNKASWHIYSMYFTRITWCIQYIWLCHFY